ncbi:hypothetical protein [Methanobacterium sp.]|uniref:hypothetical protein n=1 Tax=Methanobacterium sp. TaxID=2164 RepID=UPI0025F74755|nr:hypothetical protein [Methanobacterium sp.]MBI5458822.1 hypothetical protein [Methanobacterium sp.]
MKKKYTHLLGWIFAGCFFVFVILAFVGGILTVSSSKEKYDGAVNETGLSSDDAEIIQSKAVEYIQENFYNLTGDDVDHYIWTYSPEQEKGNLIVVDWYSKMQCWDFISILKRLMVSG